MMKRRTVLKIIGGFLVAPYLPKEPEIKPIEVTEHFLTDDWVDLNPNGFGLAPEKKQGTRVRYL